MTLLSPEEWQAVALSLRVALWATLAGLPFGVLTAYALARWEFPGKQVVNGLVHLPLILPPVVTGYLLLLTFGTRGPIGAPLKEIGIVFAFRWTGAALAAADAAATDGCGGGASRCFGGAACGRGGGRCGGGAGGGAGAEHEAAPAAAAAAAGAATLSSSCLSRFCISSRAACGGGAGGCCGG